MRGEKRGSLARVSPLFFYVSSYPTYVKYLCFPSLCRALRVSHMMTLPPMRLAALSATMAASRSSKQWRQCAPRSLQLQL